LPPVKRDRPAGSLSTSRYTSYCPTAMLLTAQFSTTPALVELIVNVTVPEPDELELEELELEELELEELELDELLEELELDELGAFAPELDELELEELELEELELEELDELELEELEELELDELELDELEPVVAAVPACGLSKYAFNHRPGAVKSASTQGPDKGAVGIKIEEASSLLPSDQLIQLKPF
jgi:hypothetical protein